MLTVPPGEDIAAYHNPASALDAAAVAGMARRLGGSVEVRRSGPAGSVTVARAGTA